LTSWVIISFSRMTLLCKVSSSKFNTSDSRAVRSLIPGKAGSKGSTVRQHKVAYTETSFEVWYSEFNKWLLEYTLTDISTRASHLVTKLPPFFSGLLKEPFLYLYPVLPYFLLYIFFHLVSPPSPCSPQRSCIHHIHFLYSKCNTYWSHYILNFTNFFCSISTFRCCLMSHFQIWSLILYFLMSSRNFISTACYSAFISHSPCPYF